MTEHIRKAIRTVQKSGNATIFVENKTYPDQYGKVVMDGNRKVIEIFGSEFIRHYYSIASFYVFPNSVLKHLANLQPSERGRLEVLDLNKRFFEECKLQVRILDNNCIWFDTNSVDTILRCAEYMMKNKRN